MKITIVGNSVAFMGYVIGAYLAALTGAEDWQAIIAGAAFAFTLLAVCPKTIE